ncbi:MAG TPA: hypothetical protein PKV62_01355 [Oscillospiraceae bacterium]|nr:hypothetical protein [Oscillospiraceae bacterium]
MERRTADNNGLRNPIWSKALCLALSMVLSAAAFSACGADLPSSSGETASSSSVAAQSSDAQPAAAESSPESTPPSDSTPSESVPTVTISLDAEDCYETYLAAWTFYSPQRYDFTDGCPEIVDESALELMFNSCWSLDYQRAHDGDRTGWQNALYAASENYNFPADLVEETIGRYFNLGADDIRAAAGEKYDAESGAYFFPGGFGGFDKVGEVTGVRLEGDLLELDSSWYIGTTDEFQWSCTTTIQLQPDGSWKYLTNVVTGTAEG